MGDNDPLAGLLGLATDRSEPGPWDRYVLVPRTNPRFAIPIGNPQATRAVLDQLSTPPPWARRALATVNGAVGFPPGIGHRLRVASMDSLAQHLAALCGVDRVALGVKLGPPRPNRKPVVQVCQPDGTTLAWAKLGWNPLAERLVSNEEAWLDNLAARPLPGVTAPRVIARSQWQGAIMLVTAHLGDGLRQGPGVVTGAEQVTASLSSMTASESVPLARSTWFDNTTRRVGEILDASLRRSLERILAVLADKAGSRELGFAAWHGDLAAHNFAARHGRLIVWDWERAASDRPEGIDVAHASFEAAQFNRHLDAATAAACADRHLRSLGQPLRHLAPHGSLLVDCYLVERLLRWVEDEAVGGHYANPGRPRGMLAALLARIDA